MCRQFLYSYGQQLSWVPLSISLISKNPDSILSITNFSLLLNLKVFSKSISDSEFLNEVSLMLTQDSDLIPAKINIRFSFI